MLGEWLETTMIELRDAAAAASLSPDEVERSLSFAEATLRTLLRQVFERDRRRKLH